MAQPADPGPQPQLPLAAVQRPEPVRGEETRCLVEVAVSLPVDGPFTYAVPEGLTLELGHAVLVPFGRRRVAGYVVGPASAEAARELGTIKEVSRLLDPVPAFDPTQLRFFRWAAGYYLAGLGEVIATALPTAYRARTRRVHLASEAGIEALAAESISDEVQAQVLREVVSRPERTEAGLRRIFHGEVEEAEVRRALAALVRARLVVVEQREVSTPQARSTWVVLEARAEEQPLQGGARMRGVLAAVIEAGGEAPLADLVEAEGPGARGAVKRLVSKGLLRTEEREDRHAVTVGELGHQPRDPLPPTPGQEAALAALAGEARTWLLHGVTGSGKTEVYLQAAARILEEGRQVLILVPEIALTPQLTGRVRARFGDAVAVLHSALTPVERLREWRRIRAGEAQVAVGARSALFAPFKDLGLVVVDEEHDDSYKQDDGVRYHARDLAVVRGHMSGAAVVLGSATPSLESWQNARQGRYGRLLLTERATPRRVPSIELVDMRGRPAAEAVAPEVLDALRQTLDGGGKAIVLYNRRGYAPVVECPSCGGHYSCPSCGVGMVYHRGRARVTCHYCGFHRPFERDCPICKGELQVQGFGTERIEEDLDAAFPGAGILRMDADTTRKRGSHHEILSAFKEPEHRLLVGTQLVAKGHDFPDVHMAAVVGVDHILMLPDFRSAERTFALVTQLAGRAGRGEVAGRVLVQTRHADHFVFRMLSEGDSPVGAAQEAGDPADAAEAMDAFYTEEVRQRQILRYPPFARLVLLRIEGTDRDATQSRARQLARELRHAAGTYRDQIDVLGPVTAPLARLVGRWRFQLVLRGRHQGVFRRWLEAQRSLLRSATRAGVRVTLDVDPRSLL